MKVRVKEERRDKERKGGYVDEKRKKKRRRIGDDKVGGEDGFVRRKRTMKGHELTKEKVEWR